MGAARVAVSVVLVVLVVPGGWVAAGPRAGRDPPARNDKNDKNDGHGDTSRPHSQRAQGSHAPCGRAPPHSDLESVFFELRIFTLALLFLFKFWLCTEI